MKPKPPPSPPPMPKPTTTKPTINGNVGGEKGGKEDCKNDISLLMKSISTSASSLSDILKLLDNSTPEIVDLISNECDILLECKICKNMFRSLANFMTHKRGFCIEKFKKLYRNHEFQNPDHVWYSKCRQNKVLYSRSTTRKDILDLIEAMKGTTESSTPEEVILRQLTQTNEGLFNLRYDSQSADKTEKCGMVTEKEVEEGSSAEAGGGGKKGKEKQKDREREDRVSPPEAGGSPRVAYLCPCCKKCLSNNWSVYRHLYRVHRKSSEQVRKLRHQIQRKEITSGDEVEREKKGHISAFNDRDQEQAYVEDLKGHTSQFQCPECGRRFERNVALISHAKHCQKKPTKQLELLRSLKRKSLTPIKAGDEKKHKYTHEELMINQIIYLEPRVVIKKTDFPSIMNIKKEVEVSQDEDMMENYEEEEINTFVKAFQGGNGDIELKSNELVDILEKMHSAVNDVEQISLSDTENDTTESEQTKSKLDETHNEEVADFVEQNATEEAHISDADIDIESQSKDSEGNEEEVETSVKECNGQKESCPPVDIVIESRIDISNDEDSAQEKEYPHAFFVPEVTENKQFYEEEVVCFDSESSLDGMEEMVESETREDELMDSNRQQLPRKESSEEDSQGLNSSNHNDNDSSPKTEFLLESSPDKCRKTYSRQKRSTPDMDSPKNRIYAPFLKITAGNHLNCGVEVGSSTNTNHNLESLQKCSDSENSQDTFVGFKSENHYKPEDYNSLVDRLLQSITKNRKKVLMKEKTMENVRKFTLSNEEESAGKRKDVENVVCSKHVVEYDGLEYISNYEDEELGIETNGSIAENEEARDNAETSGKDERICEAGEEEADDWLLKKINSYLSIRKKKCLLCMKTFHKVSLVRRHIASHYNIHKFQCLINSCGFKSFLRADMDAHLFKVHKKKETDLFIGRIHPKMEDFEKSLYNPSPQTSSWKVAKADMVTISPSECDLTYSIIDEDCLESLNFSTEIELCLT